VVTWRPVGWLGRNGELLVVGQYLADFGGPQPPVLSVLQYLGNICEVTVTFSQSVSQSVSNEQQQ
jgi:hypothetical protein